MVTIIHKTTRSGYKSTQVGMIPNAWKVVRLGDLLKVRHGRSQKGIEVSDGKYPILATGGEIGRTNEYLFSKPSVLIGRKGTIDKPRYMTAPFWTVDTLFYTEIFDNADPKYVFYKFSTIDWYLYNEASGVPSLNAKTIEGIEVALPPTREEQSAIAAVLSDVDDLISLLSLKIEKKRSIKIATLQQLLTGKKRLPGFTDKWEKKDLGSVSEKIIGGGTPSRSNPSFWKGDIPWVTVKDFATFDPTFAQESITEEGLKNSSSHLIPKGTIITSTRMALGKAVIYEVDVSINQDLKAIFPTADVDSSFLCYWFQKNAEYIESLGSGSTVMGISLHDLRAIEFLKPTLSEQVAIVRVLSDMDKEITQHEAYLRKTQELKQGMMQKLLTGNIRLI